MRERAPDPAPVPVRERALGQVPEREQVPERALGQAREQERDLAGVLVVLPPEPDLQVRALRPSAPRAERPPRTVWGPPRPAAAPAW